MAHKHADKMHEYAADALETDKPWERWQVQIPDSRHWHDIEMFHPEWMESCEYRRKPLTSRERFDDWRYRMENSGFPRESLLWRAWLESERQAKENQ